MRQADDGDEPFSLEEMREQIGRREILIGAVAVGGGVVLLTSDSGRQNHLRQAETQLAELASTIDSTDLVDPQQSGPLRTKITNTVESVNRELDQASSGNQQAEQQISALRAATTYYDSLEAALASAVTLQTRLEESESTVLYHDGSLGYEPTTRFDTATFEESITRLSETQIDTGTATDRARKLVPAQSDVIDSLHEQRTVYQHHITAQQIYLDTSVGIEAGVRAHEQSRFQRARSKLTTAQEKLSTEIPPSKRPYRLFYGGLSLDQYASLFARRRDGVAKLLEVADESVPVQRRRSGSNRALDHFFKARQVVTG